MPSDDIDTLVRSALSAPQDRFHSALAKAVEEVRAYLATHRSRVGAQDADGRAALGSFAAGRIDVTRFAALLSKEPEADIETLRRVARAFDALVAVTRREEALTRVDVESGGDLRASVARALEGLGQAFGAARVAELSRRGRFDAERHDTLLSAMPFARWSAAERALAPPLVVRVDGGDLHAAGLAEFLDGALRIVLDVRGAAPPAPLARLVSPGLFVLQTSDGAGLERFAAWDGPGIAAILRESDGAAPARFVHDPAGGPHLADRLDVAFVPADDPTAARGQVSVRQQVEDLGQLRVLAERAAPPAPAASVVPAAGVPSAAGAAPTAGAVAGTASATDPVDKLAAWLLAQAELPGDG